MVDEVASGAVPDVEDDPYQVYMLRRPAERSSSVVPQLPKQPEMADTRLRYRRIAPEARSGSFGSLGGHFPARFEFPNRRSLLESLTSDDEASSFAVRRPRKDPDKQKKKKKKRTTRPTSSASDSTDTHNPSKPPLPTVKPPPLAIASPRAHSHDDSQHRDSSDSSTPLSTSPTTPVPGSPIEGQLGLSIHPDHAETLAHAAALRLAAHSDPLPESNHKTETATTFPANKEDPQLTPKKRRTLSPRQIIHTHKDEKQDEKHHRSTDPAKARRAHSHHKPLTYRPSDNPKPEHPDSSATPRRMHSVHASASTHASRTRPSAPGITVSVDGRPISAPESMHPSLRERFVLVPEEPVAYGSSSRRPQSTQRARTKKKTSRKKKQDGHGRPPRPARQEKTQMENNTRRREDMPLDEGDDDVFARDKELSVSFAHRRLTAEEAAAKPLSAIQRLWHALAFARMSGNSRGRR